MASKPSATAHIEHKDGNQHESKSLKSAVHEAVKDAEHDASTGDVATAKSPDSSLPTGTRRSRPPE